MSLGILTSLIPGAISGVGKFASDIAEGKDFGTSLAEGVGAFAGLGSKAAEEQIEYEKPKLPKVKPKKKKKKGKKKPRKTYRAGRVDINEYIDDDIDDDYDYDDYDDYFRDDYYHDADGALDTEYDHHPRYTIFGKPQNSADVFGASSGVDLSFGPNKRTYVDSRGVSKSVPSFMAKEKRQARRRRPVRRRKPARRRAPKKNTKKKSNTRKRRKVSKKPKKSMAKSKSRKTNVKSKKKSKPKPKSKPRKKSKPKKEKETITIDDDKVKIENPTDDSNIVIKPDSCPNKDRKEEVIEMIAI